MEQHDNQGRKTSADEKSSEQRSGQSTTAGGPEKSAGAASQQSQDSSRDTSNRGASRQSSSQAQASRSSSSQQSSSSQRSSSQSTSQQYGSGSRSDTDTRREQSGRDSRGLGSGLDLRELGSELLRDSASRISERLAQQSISIVEERRDRFASEICDYAESLRSTAGRLKEDDAVYLSNYAESIADLIEDGAERLRRTSPSDVLEAIEETVRRQPVLCLGGLFVAGLVAARFLKASSPHSAQGEYTHEMRSRSRTGTVPSDHELHQPSR